MTGGELPIARRGESGFTIIEVMAVVLLMGIFGIAVETSLAAFIRTTRATDYKTMAVADVRLAEEAIARDLRAANPIDDISPLSVATYQNKVTFSVYCSTPGTGSCGADRLRSVTYQLVSNRLEQVIGSTTRVLVGPNGHTDVPVSQRLGAVVNAIDEPIFTYIDRSGQVFDTTGTNSSVTTRRVHDCTKSVRIHLKVISEPRKTTTPYNLVTTVELRNYNEVNGC
jgi:type II secretory pathway pseudopilin PulG